jgi:hypothetical protein
MRELRTCLKAFLSGGETAGLLGAGRYMDPAHLDWAMSYETVAVSWRKRSLMWSKLLKKHIGFYGSSRNSGRSTLLPQPGAVALKGVAYGWPKLLRLPKRCIMLPSGRAASVKVNDAFQPWLP